MTTKLKRILIKTSDSSNYLGIPKCTTCGAYHSLCERCGEIRKDFIFKPCECGHLAPYICTCKNSKASTGAAISNVDFLMDARNALRLLGEEIQEPGKHLGSKIPTITLPEKFNFKPSRHDYQRRKLALLSKKYNKHIDHVASEIKEEDAKSEVAHYENTRFYREFAPSTDLRPSRPVVKKQTARIDPEKVKEQEAARRKRVAELKRQKELRQAKALKQQQQKAEQERKEREAEAETERIKAEQKRAADAFRAEQLRKKRDRENRIREQFKKKLDEDAKATPMVGADDEALAASLKKAQDKLDEEERQRQIEEQEKKAEQEKARQKRVNEERARRLRERKERENRIREQFKKKLEEDAKATQMVNADDEALAASLKKAQDKLDEEERQRQIEEQEKKAEEERQRQLEVQVEALKEQKRQAILEIGKFAQNEVSKINKEFDKEGLKAKVIADMDEIAELAKKAVNAKYTELVEKRRQKDIEEAVRAAEEEKKALKKAKRQAIIDIGKFAQNEVSNINKEFDREGLKAKVIADMDEIAELAKKAVIAKDKELKEKRRREEAERVVDPPLIDLNKFKMPKNNIDGTFNQSEMNAFQMATFIDDDWDDNDNLRITTWDPETYFDPNNEDHELVFTPPNFIDTLDALILYSRTEQSDENVISNDIDVPPMIRVYANFVLDRIKKNGLDDIIRSMAGASNDTSIDDIIVEYLIPIAINNTGVTTLVGETKKEQEEVEEQEKTQRLFNRLEEGNQQRIFRILNAGELIKEADYNSSNVDAIKLTPWDDTRFGNMGPAVQGAYNQLSFYISGEEGDVDVKDTQWFKGAMFALSANAVADSLGNDIYMNKLLGYKSFKGVLGDLNPTKLTELRDSIKHSEFLKAGVIFHVYKYMFPYTDYITEMQPTSVIFNDFADLKKTIHGTSPATDGVDSLVAEVEQELEEEIDLVPPPAPPPAPAPASTPAQLDGFEGAVAISASLSKKDISGMIKSDENLERLQRFLDSKDVSYKDLNWTDTKKLAAKNAVGSSEASSVAPKAPFGSSVTTYYRTTTETGQASKDDLIKYVREHKRYYLANDGNEDDLGDFERNKTNANKAADKILKVAKAKGAAFYMIDLPPPIQEEDEDEFADATPNTIMGGDSEVMPKSGDTDSVGFESLPSSDDDEEQAQPKEQMLGTDKASQGPLVAQDAEETGGEDEDEEKDYGAFADLSIYSPGEKELLVMLSNDDGDDFIPYDQHPSDYYLTAWNGDETSNDQKVLARKVLGKGDEWVPATEDEAGDAHAIMTTTSGFIKNSVKSYDGGYTINRQDINTLNVKLGTGATAISGGTGDVKTAIAILAIFRKYRDETK